MSWLAGMLIAQVWHLTFFADNINQIKFIPSEVLEQPGHLLNVLRHEKTCFLHM